MSMFAGENALDERMRSAAGRFIATCRHDSGIELRYDRESVAWAAAHLERLRASTDLSCLGFLLASVAAFLGESIIAAHGGTWIDVEGEAGVRLSNGCIALPFTSVEGQVDWGPAASILQYFDGITAVLKADAEWDLRYV